jgi:hypothetical protein
MYISNIPGTSSMSDSVANPVGITAVTVGRGRSDESDEELTSGEERGQWRSWPS